MIQTTRFPPGSRAAKIYTWVRIGIFAILVVAVGRFAWIYERWPVPAACKGMRPKFGPGQTLLLHTRYRQANSLQRGDVVVFATRDAGTGQRQELLSRVIGLPGETIQLVEGRIHIDEEEIADPWSVAHGPPLRTLSTGPVHVGPRSVYLLNDDRQDSALDGRLLGPVSQEAIRGKVVISLGF